MAEALQVRNRQPHHLQALLQAWRQQPSKMYRAPPTLAFAVIGQARSDGRMNPEQESAILSKLLTHWALSSTLQVSEDCSRQGWGHRTPEFKLAIKY